MEQLRAPPDSSSLRDAHIVAIDVKNHRNFRADQTEAEN